MGQLSGNFKLGIIRRIWNSAPDGASTFYEALDGFQNARFRDVQSGRQVSSTSNAGHSTSFIIPTNDLRGNAFTPADFFELLEELLASYEQAQANGVTDEDQILAYMRGIYRPIRGFSQNWMWINK